MDKGMSRSRQPSADILWPVGQPTVHKNWHLYARLTTYHIYSLVPRPPQDFIMAFTSEAVTKSLGRPGDEAITTCMPELRHHEEFVHY